MALTLAGAGGEALDVSEDLLAAAETTDNPCEQIWALMGYGMIRWDFNGRARQDFDPVVAFDVLSRALRIAQESGNRQLETHTAAAVAALAAARGNPTDAFDLFALAIRYYHDAGSFSHMHTPLGWLAAFLDQLGHPAPAATIAGFALDFYVRVTNPQIVDTTITHLRESLGEQAYESLARTGASMTNSEMASYALDQIDRARTRLQQEESR